MVKAKSQVLIKGNYDNTIAFNIKRSQDEATVWKQTPAGSEQWVLIPIALADKLYSDALEEGYTVAF